MILKIYEPRKIVFLKVQKFRPYPKFDNMTRTRKLSIGQEKVNDSADSCKISWYSYLTKLKFFNFDTVV